MWVDLDDRCIAQSSIEKVAQPLPQSIHTHT